MEKLQTISKAVQLLSDGDTVMVGGFGLCGTPFSLIDALAEQDKARNLTVISNNLGEPGRGLGKLLLSGHLKKAIGSYFTTNVDAVEAYNRGELDIELFPQGTLAEAIRAGGAGIGGFYTPTGVGTKLAEGKEIRDIDGTKYLFVKGLTADVALIKAHQADTLGNLTYAKTARNFNPLMATAAELVIAEVDEIVPTGSIPPEAVVTPHVYVDVVVESERYEKKGGHYVAKGS
ncbi:MAG: CoA transferase subunit A [Novibacillus thermophilus]|uniref:Succinyl-CoA--3-ketoacid-CoA transferase n=1 Tax=Novibacillus thermophilus TaxID=1471761 RepID=A0A1U9K8G3_9BACL|nr:CoA transferase subunit A [Novibacillus thermophilus]AQS56322.1 succinyl-CoA--3-ketoacid-CoA transferase [Novibacillus thermophilus]